MPYGDRFRVEIPIVGPAGSAIVRTLWIIRTGEDVPRLTSANERRGQRLRRPPRFELLQVVHVRDAHPGLAVVKRECGTAYLVEFIEDDGATKAEAAFAPDQLSATPPPP